MAKRLKLLEQLVKHQAQTKYHTVVKGDCLWIIAKNNEITVSKIKSMNKLKSDIIFPGQRLRVQ
ncbi:hypothetical protein CWO92_24695 [Heyndrickxia camelliae]|uniref:LysM domain-containing protein n=1 Tax=Heyndrickxia camelliae TaxID=1707093 RepID=A0A2N3LCR5_9BACI|nr:hypothetical protein CWO92_24695 [Heyndrickxia camelliae]